MAKKVEHGGPAAPAPAPAAEEKAELYMRTKLKLSPSMIADQPDIDLIAFKMGENVDTVFYKNNLGEKFQMNRLTFETCFLPLTYLITAIR